MSNAKYKALRSKAQSLKHILSVGKNGLSEGSLALIDRELEQKELIKIKLLNSALDQWDRGGLVEEICRETKSTKISLVGHMLVLYRKSSS